MRHERVLQSLSLIIPIYNEEEGMDFLRSSITAWLPSLGNLNVEVLLVNDGSKDNSLSLLEKWAEDDARVKIVSFSRNFGHQAAVSAGLHFSSKEAAVIMDADLQDPLEVINKMVEFYNQGYDVAYGQRTRREGESVFKKGSAWLFYRLMRLGMGVDMPADTGDFRLVSRAVINAVGSMPEGHRFLRGMFAWVGFKSIAVPYARAPRKYGETKYPLRKMLKFAWNGITSFSIFPIKAITIAGLLITALGGIVGVYSVFSYMIGQAVAGWTSLMCLQVFIGGGILFSLGIIGEYVGRIYEEVKRRPQYLVEFTKNF